MRVTETRATPEQCSHHSCKSHPPHPPKRKQTKLPTRGPSHEEVDYRTCHSEHLFILSSKKRPGAAVSLENKVFIKKLDIEHPYSLCEKGPSHFPLAQDDSYGKIRMLKDGGISLTENEVMIYNN